MKFPCPPSCAVRLTRTGLTFADYVAELVVKYQIPLTLAHTASRGYHLQQTIPRPRKRDNNPRARLPAAMPALPHVFICVSAVCAPFNARPSCFKCRSREPLLGVAPARRAVVRRVKCRDGAANGASVRCPFDERSAVGGTRAKQKGSRLAGELDSNCALCILHEREMR